MPDGANHQQLIDQLAGRLEPVRRLPGPWRRTLVWCGAVLWVGALFALFADFPALWQRLVSAPDMSVSLAGALLTSVSAAWAAFATSVPGRSPAWAMLPLPPLALWLAASTAGCLRMHTIAGAQPEPPMHPMTCMNFIVLVAVPLASLLMWQIMRACPLRPALTASLAGLASAGAAAVILSLVHPFDATYTDLLAHLVAVSVVIVAVRLVGARAAKKDVLF